MKLHSIKINDEVYVKLTKDGLEILKSYFNNLTNWSVEEYLANNSKEELVSFQLHMFAVVFGSHMVTGCNLFFENNCIYINDNSEKYNISLVFQDEIYTLIEKPIYLRKKFTIDKIDYICDQKPPAVGDLIVFEGDHENSVFTLDTETSGEDWVVIAWSKN